MKKVSLGMVGVAFVAASCSGLDQSNTDRSGVTSNATTAWSDARGAAVIPTTVYPDGRCTRTIIDAERQPNGALGNAIVVVATVDPPDQNGNYDYSTVRITRKVGLDGPVPGSVIANTRAICRATRNMRLLDLRR